MSGRAREGRLAAGLLLLALLGGGCQTVGGTAGHLTGLPGDAGRAAEATRIAAQAAPKVQAAFADIEEPQEIEIGRAVTAQVGKRYTILRDPALTRYVALVGNAVAAHSDRPDLRYYFAVLAADDVNAFAAPGGFVFVTRGALAVARDEAMLAGLLGHEIAHVALRHGVAAIRAQKQTELAMFGVREGLAHSRVAGFGQAIGSTADFFFEQIVLKGYSREQEAEADRAGFKYAQRAGYAPAGLREFLSAMLDRGGEQEAARAQFFSTHPGTRERRDEQDRLLKAEPTTGRRNPERFVRVVSTSGPAGARTALAVTSQFERSLEASGRYVSQTIAFDLDRLRPESDAELKMIGGALAANPSLRLRIEGHTDSTGDPQRNLLLSKRRAEAVRAYLVRALGVNASRLTAEGIGAARPIAPNHTVDGRARNRRIEFVKQ